MSTAELKASISQLLHGISDDSVLKAVYTLLSKVSNNEKDWADELPSNILDELLLSIREAEKGEKGTSHADMMAQARKEFPQLKL